MGKIVAIGGGSLTDTEPPGNTNIIDTEIIKLSGLKSPSVLFIPTASGDDREYIARFKQAYSINLNCNVEVLELYNNPQDRLPKEFIDKIHQSDIIYVGGGNTLKMMNLWKRLGVDKELRKAYKNNKVLSGLSAGAICWFESGNSDSRKFANPNASLIRVTALGLIKCLMCPHYDTESDRKPDLKKMMKRIKGVAIALDNLAAIQIVDNSYKIITAKNDANAYKVFWKDNIFYEIPLEKSENYLSLRTLTRMI